MMIAECGMRNVKPKPRRAAAAFADGCFPLRTPHSALCIPPLRRLAALLVLTGLSAGVQLAGAERVRVAVVARPAAWWATALARATLARLCELKQVWPANPEVAQRLVPAGPDAPLKEVVEAGKRLRAQFVALVAWPEIPREDAELPWEEADADADLVDVATGASQFYGLTAPLPELPGFVALALAEGMRLKVSAEERERVRKPLAANDEAIRALWQGDACPKPEDQIRNYELALHHDPQSALIHNQLGAALARASRLAEARAEFDRAIALDPAYAAPHTNRAIVLKREQKWPEAEAACRRAIALGPKSPTPYFELAILLDRAGGPKAAVEQLEKAIEVDPSHLGALMTLGVYYFEQSNFAAAQRCFDRVLEIEPKNVEALNHVGLLLLVPQDYDKAAATFRKALAIQPDSPSTLANLGLALYGQKKAKEAIDSVQRAIALDRRCANSYLYLGRICLLEKRYGEAAEALQRAVELNPELPGAREALANAQAMSRAKSSGCGCLGGGGPALGPAEAALSALLPVALLLGPHAVRQARRRRHP